MTEERGAVAERIGAQRRTGIPGFHADKTANDKTNLEAAFRYHKPLDRRDIISRRR